MRLIVGITGASGVIYGKRFLEVAKEKKLEVHLIVSDAAEKVAEYELGNVNWSTLASKLYSPDNLAAPLASGSFKVDAMIIVPASMKTIGALASGYCDDLISRAADVQLKEGRKLIVVPRETPLHVIHLENMAKLSRIGVTVLPAMPGFYHEPKTIEDLVDFVVGKILDQLEIPHELFRRWGTSSPASTPFQDD
jgi:4-hydroxy-3-polyprenylbenzoate decarboxylase